VPERSESGAIPDTSRRTLAGVSTFPQVQTSPTHLRYSLHHRFTSHSFHSGYRPAGLTLMSTVETAASLFRSDDNAPDPFASLGVEEPESAAGSHGSVTNSNDPFNAQPVSDASNLFAQDAASSAFDFDAPTSYFDTPHSYDGDHSTGGQQPSQDGGYEQRAGYPSHDMQTSIGMLAVVRVRFCDSHADDRKCYQWPIWGRVCVQFVFACDLYRSAR
jgi:hypothetical protein